MIFSAHEARDINRSAEVIARTLACGRPRCPCGKRQDKEWRTHCPCHDDAHPSLSVTEAENGKPLVYCHAGCPQEKVIAALRQRGLWLESADGYWHEEPEATYDYRDGAGHLLFQVVRYPHKKFKQRRPDGGGAWIWNLDNARRVPYRLPGLLAAPRDAWVYIPEGEKDVDRLLALNLVATTNPGGAGKWRQDFGPYFEGRRVAVLPDNDDAGRCHSQQVAQTLAPYASVVKALELPGLAPGGDVSDWLAQEHTAEELLALVEEAQEFRFGHAIHMERDQNRIISAKQLLEEEIPAIDWKCRGLLAAGHITLLSARAKMGKTTLVFHLLQALLEGQPFLGLPTALTERVLLLSEESRGLLRRRIESLRLGSDDLLILTRHGVASWEQALEAIKRAIDEGVELLVVDTLAAFWEVRDQNDATEVMAFLLTLQELAQERGIAILLVHHLRKMAGEEGTAHRGSGALVAAVDIALEMRLRPNSPRQRHLIALSRFEETSPELVIELAEDGDYRSLGTPSEVSRQDVSSQVLDTLPGPEEEAITREELSERLDPKPSNTLLKEVLSALDAEGYVRKEGEGKKGSPYRYALAQERPAATPTQNPISVTPHICTVTESEVQELPQAAISNNGRHAAALSLWEQCDRRPIPVKRGETITDLERWLRWPHTNEEVQQVIAVLKGMAGPEAEGGT
jgi:KaiC/GvpD/RAD55 family RecA-like ATPase